MANPEKVRRIYNRCAGSYDSATSKLGPMRGRLFSRAKGDVLELGVGTGATFAHYPPTLTSLTAIDISEAMLARAQQRARNLPFPVTLQRADFQTLPFADASFDTVVSSLALCGIPDPTLLFAEIKRVLRPGGQLLALEHIRPANPMLAVITNLGNPIYHYFVGCYLNRPTPNLLRKAGFTVTVQEQRMMGGMVALVAVVRR